MGKVDDMRAMREARYAARQKPVTPAKKAATAKKALEQASRAVSASVEKPAADELCGHRSIGNKSCTRTKAEHDGGTKNHRYK